MNNKLKESGIFIIQTGGIFILIIGLPYIISGIWPPFVSVVSDSMEPNIVKGDMVFIVDNERYAENDSIHGIDPSNGESGSGDVIVYRPNGDPKETPVIHRAIEYTEKGEDWTKSIDKEHLSTESCTAIINCPSPHDGFITLGDANSRVDQDAGISKPVKHEWIVGKSMQKIPLLGWVRIIFTSIL